MRRQTDHLNHILLSKKGVNGADNTGHVEAELTWWSYGT